MKPIPALVGNDQHGGEFLMPLRLREIYCIENGTTRTNGKISLRAMLEGTAFNIDIA
jgi:hypothetical protein